MSTRGTPTTAPPSTRPEVDDGSGDHDRFAHYVRSGDLDRAWLDGRPIVALCGKRWVPTRDPSRYPLCPSCAEIKQALST